MIPKIVNFDIFTSYLLTEPDSGSDAQDIKTIALDKGNGFYELNGTKSFVSGAGATDLLIVICKTGEKEVSCFAVDKESKGISFRKNELKVIIIITPLLDGVECLTSQDGII